MHVCGQSATVCTVCVTTVQAVVVCVGRGPVRRASLGTCATRLPNTATPTGCTLIVTSTQSVFSLDHCSRKRCSGQACLLVRLQKKQYLYAVVTFFLKAHFFCFFDTGVRAKTATRATATLALWLTLAWRATVEAVTLMWGVMLDVCVHVCVVVLVILFHPQDRQILDTYYK